MRSRQYSQLDLGGLEAEDIFKLGSELSDYDWNRINKARRKKRNYETCQQRDTGILGP